MKAFMGIFILTVIIDQQVFAKNNKKIAGRNPASNCEVIYYINEITNINSKELTDKIVKGAEAKGYTVKVFDDVEAANDPEIKYKNREWMLWQDDVNYPVGTKFLNLGGVESHKNNFRRNCTIDFDLSEKVALSKNSDGSLNRNISKVLANVSHKTTVHLESKSNECLISIEKSLAKLSFCK